MMKRKPIMYNETEVIHIETEHRYKSMSQASRSLDICVGRIQKSCASNGEIAAKGNHFVYADENRRRRIALKEAENWNLLDDF